MVKPRARQRKATLQTRPLHPDCAEARQCILEVAGADEHIEDAAEEEVGQLILQAVQLDLADDSEDDEEVE